MSGTRANMIKARGLITYGSELSVSEGSQRQATNVNIDEDGVITPRRGFNDYKGPTTGVEAVPPIVNQILEYKEAILRQYQNEFFEYEDDNGVFQPVTGSYNTLREGYRTKWTESNSNLYFTSDEGIKKISEKSSADLNADMIKDANAMKNGDINDGKGYPIEDMIIPILVGFLMVPFVWMAMSLVEMNWQTALVTSVSFGFVSRELLVTKIAKVVGE